ncbi:GNAT family N-acetyltransferase [Microbacterium sp. JZ31]|uniref:GNAT family N-acetyltransferase n=1 Tax=Microbacterium sp. JZ31 TaxID=1906274 RepID=UPI0019331724|nr:GNAT family N-acetyltransferase [Microbacterium sp. JZ31]
MTVTLEPMPAERFDAWRAETAARFAALRRESGMLPPAEAQEQGEGIVASRLPDGVHSADQHVCQIRDDGRVVGTAWLEVRADPPHAMLYALVADDARTGSAALALVEERARALGAAILRIDLFAQDDAGWALLEDRGYRATDIQMLLAPLPAPRTPGDLVLTRMTAERYAAFEARVIAEFAEDLVNEGLHTPESARAESARQQAEAMPDGVDTEDGLVFRATVDDVVVGALWLDVQRRSTGPHVFVMELHVEPAHRRRGFGAAMMRAAEDEARRLGADSIGLHVFGSNHAARALYRGLGYREAEVLLAKDLTRG